MKKRFYIASLSAILLTACQTDEPRPQKENYDDWVFGNATSSLRTIDEAAEIAQEGITMIEGPAISRTGGRKFDRNSVKAITSPRGRSGAADTLMYVFNFDDELIAITESGSYDPAQGTDNPGLALYMDYAENYLRAIPDTISKFEPEDPIPGGDNRVQYKTTTDTVYKHRVYPKLKVRWGQIEPEGRYCPNGIAGCSNTAMAMCLSYLKYPSEINLSYLGSSSKTQQLTWSRLSKYDKNYRRVMVDFNTGEEIDLTDYESPEELAQLCRELGFRADSRYKYNPNRTSTKWTGVQYVLNSLGFDISEIKTYSNGTLESFFRTDNSIVLIGGRRTDNAGHMWVIDGINYYSIRGREYIKNPGEDWKIINEAYTLYAYNHMNWGWDGSSNGYFLSDVFDATKPFSSDRMTLPVGEDSNTEFKGSSYDFGASVSIMSVRI